MQVHKTHLHTIHNLQNVNNQQNAISPVMFKWRKNHKPWNVSCTRIPALINLTQIQIRGISWWCKGGRCAPRRQISTVRTTLWQNQKAAIKGWSIVWAHSWEKNMSQPFLVTSWHAFHLPPPPLSHLYSPTTRTAKVFVRQRVYRRQRQYVAKSFSDSLLQWSNSQLWGNPKVSGWKPDG